MNVRSTCPYCGVGCGVAVIDGIPRGDEAHPANFGRLCSKGAALKDPSGLFNASLEGNTRRAIDFQEGEKVKEEALKTLVRAAVTLNKSKGRR